jgi:hypothetical protein
MTSELDDTLRVPVLDAAKCNLKAGPATEEDARRLFGHLARQYLKMADAVCDVIEKRNPGGLSAEMDNQSPP